MGWSVRIHEYVAKVVVCNEDGCPFRGTPNLSDHELEKERDEHYAHHSKLYREEQEAIDRANEGFSEAAVERLMAAVQTAFDDIEADFPEVESGFELDVARSTLDAEEGFDSDRDEAWRRLFGTVTR